MSSLEDIMMKLSINDNENTNSGDFFDSISPDLINQIESYTDQVDALARSLLSVPNEADREENKLELITVFSIIKTIKYIHQLLNDPLTLETSRKIGLLLSSFVILFKYHFQLPINHNNYAFKNFGILLCSPNLNIITPFLKFITLSSISFSELNKSENLEKSFTLVFTLHCFNPDLFKFITNYLNTNITKDIFYTFNLNNIAVTSSKLNSFPTVFQVMQRFRMTILLEDSLLTSDTRSNNLLNILFYSSYHKPYLSELITNIININNSLQKVSQDLLFRMANNCLQNQNYLDVLTIHITSDLTHFQLLDDYVKSDDTTLANLTDLSMFLLLKISSNYLLNYNHFMIPNNELLSFLIEYNNHNYTSILGIAEDNNSSQLNIATLLPIFEIVDQNVKLNYDEELDFLRNFKISLVNLDLNLDSLEDFMNLNSLLVDVGSSLSIHALIDTIQSLLCIIIDNIKFNNYPVFNKIPKNFQDYLGFQFIPPVYRSDMSFENNLSLQSENYGPLFNSLLSIENLSIFKATNSYSLLIDSLTLILSIKSKIFKFLKDLNLESNVLRISDDTNVQDDNSNANIQSLNIFRSNVATKISNFKSSKALNYKLLNPSINLSLISNLLILTTSENFKILKSTDNSITRLLNEFTFDFSMSFLIIYQEFGLLNFFKSIRDLNAQNLKLIIPSSILISKLFQTPASPTTTTPSTATPTTTTTSQATATALTITKSEPTSSIDIISNLLLKNVIASNLLRQYIEIFDDSQSKPFKILNKFLKVNPSTLKPSKIGKGSVVLDVGYYVDVLN